MSEERAPGLVRLRWFGDASTTREFEDMRVDDALALAARRWFVSNMSPDAFVMSIVIERDGKQMSDEEADAYIRDQLGLKRAVREMVTLDSGRGK